MNDNHKELLKINPNILITSFKGKKNSSSMILHQIHANYLDKLELTNSFSTSVKELKCKINKNNYKYIISFGQKPNIDHIYIELNGNKHNNKITTKFPYKRFTLYLTSNKINFSLSNDAGNYLCNNIYYEGMKYIQEISSSIKMIFVHVPLISSDYNFEKLAKVISEFIASLSINN